MDSNGWQIIEAHSFNSAVGDLSGHRWVDVALAPILYALSRNPIGFPLVPGYEALYLARTTVRITGSEIYPGLHVWFRTIESIKTVELLWVEISPPDELAFTDDLWGSPDDSIPF